VLLDDFLVTMNEVVLTRPSCISLINGNSEVYSLDLSVLFNTKTVVIQKIVVSHHT